MRGLVLDCGSSSVTFELVEEKATAGPDVAGARDAFGTVRGLDLE